LACFCFTYYTFTLLILAPHLICTKGKGLSTFLQCEDQHFVLHSQHLGRRKRLQVPCSRGRELQVLQGPEVEFSPVGNHFDQSELSPGMQQHGSQWRSFDLRRHLLCYTSGASTGHTGWICQGVTSNVTSQRDMGREWGRN
jgi:hypothetical protein